MKPIVGVIDFFCGFGGLSLGLKQAGLKILAGIDAWDKAKAVYEANIESPFIHADIRQISLDNLERIINPHKPDFICFAGGPPCQPHSRALPEKWRKQKLQNWDPVFEHYAKLVLNYRPDCILLEEVPPARKYQLLRNFINSLTENGYFVTENGLLATNYGVPQKRRRFFLVASRLGKIEFPEPTTADKHKTLIEAIGHLPPLKAGETDPNDPAHTTGKITNELSLRRISYAKPGGTYADLPFELWQPVKQRYFRKFGKIPTWGAYMRLDPNQPSPTITTDIGLTRGRVIHPFQDRVISPREAALLQSFPNDFDLCPKGTKLSRTAMYKGIGNAVPPLVAKAFGEQILRFFTQVQNGNVNG